MVDCFYLFLKCGDNIKKFQQLSYRFCFSVVGCNGNTDNLSNSNNSINNTLNEAETSQIKQQNAILEKASDKNHFLLFDKSYSQYDLLNDLFYGINVNINKLMIKLNEQFPIQCLRTFDETLPYCVYKLKEGGKLFVFFDGIGVYDASNVFVIKDKLSKADFEKLTVENTLADVENIDKGVTVVNSTMNKHLLSITNKTYYMVEEGFFLIKYNDFLDKESKKTKIESIKFIPNGDRLEPFDVEMYNFYYANQEFGDGIETPSPDGFKYYFLPKDY